MSSHWAEVIGQLNQLNQAYVLVTVLGVRGSAPRDSGTKMIVTEQQSYNTIGGGNLEFMVTEQARLMLHQTASDQHLEHYPLGPKLGQCCGGSTTILFEFFASSRANVMLFGAGHVGIALSKIMLDLPVSLRWVDNRAEQFSQPLANTLEGARREGAHLEEIVSDDPAKEVASMPAASYFIIMTHDHELDFKLCMAILHRGDARFIGLIGSTTKWLRFVKRLSDAGFSESQIKKIHCPIGLTDVAGKRPMEVAVSIAGQFIANYQSEATVQTKQQGVQWKQLKAIESIAKDCSSCNACEKSLDE
ncbi:MAG: xanthine dehydrogenase accessory protein XdhC [Arenicella sp.]|nr:xanthine dehydrogenase accessory protein XdhC [Arenicella sp.]